MKDKKIYKIAKKVSKQLRKHNAAIVDAECFFSLVKECLKRSKTEPLPDFDKREEAGMPNI